MKAKLKDNFTTFEELAAKGKTLEAIDRFYADSYSQFENNEAPIVGKSANREKEEQNIAGVHNFSIAFDKVVIDEAQQIVWGKMEIRFDSKKFGPLKMTEAFFQQWEGDKIVEQRFYYKEIEKA